MSIYKDRRKNIYTITIVNRHNGYIAHIETHSNKKQAQERLDRLTHLWVNRKSTKDYTVELHTTKLQRKSQWD